jgi:hypothetical protein
MWFFLKEVNGLNIQLNVGVLLLPGIIFMIERKSYC